MNLSIVIPTYNYVCANLVKDLCIQCQSCTDIENFEIIVADDDSSNESTKDANRSINSLPFCEFREEKQNNGPSRIRHKTVLATHYEWLILIDSDAKVCTPDFIQKYVDSIKEGYDVVCGGIKTTKKYLTKHNTLRYKYEEKADSIRMLEFRQTHPYHFFTAFNILIKRSVFDEVNFDNRLEQYGYEDALFGIELERHGYSLLHIINPLIHMGIDDNKSYVRKTEQAIENMVKLKDSIGSHSPLYQCYLTLSRYHLVWAIKLWHKLFAGLEKRNLLSKHPSLTLFDIYKLGYLCLINK